YSFFLWLFPIKKNKIVISNYFGKGFGDNAKYILNELNRRNLSIDIVWLLKDELFPTIKLPINTRIVKYGSLRSLFEMATAKVWISNTRLYYSPPKRKQQYYIQTWHSPLRLKTIEKDAESNLSEYYIH